MTAKIPRKTAPHKRNEWRTLRCVVAIRTNRPEDNERRLARAVFDILDEVELPLGCSRVRVLEYRLHLAAERKKERTNDALPD